MPKSDSARPRLQTDLAEHLAAQETPRVKWKVVAQIAAAFAVLWVTAFIVKPMIGWWGVGVVGVLTLVALGFGIYIWRMTRKSAAIMDIMKSATDEAGRKRAIEALAEGGNSDAMKTIARAQLLLQTDPNEAQRVLEGLDIEKVPTMVQDDVRGLLAMLYLRNNRVNEARKMTDGIRLDRRPDPRSKGMYAAAMAEALARTGAPEDARKLLETYPAAEAADEARIMLLRAQVFTFMAQKKKGLTTQALQALAEIEPGLLGAFVYKGANPELVALAKQVLSSHMGGPKVKWQR